MFVHPPSRACVAVGEHEVKLEASERLAEPLAQPAAGKKVLHTVRHQGASLVDGAKFVVVTPKCERDF